MRLSLNNSQKLARALKKATKAKTSKIISIAPLEETSNPFSMVVIGLEIPGTVIQGAERFSPILKKQVNETCEKFYGSLDEGYTSPVIWGNACLRAGLYLYTVTFYC